MFTFFVSLHKELLEPIFSLFPIFVDNLCQVFECFVTADFISTTFGLSKKFG